MRTGTINILHDIKALLSYHTSAGINIYPGGEELQRFLVSDFKEQSVSTDKIPPSVFDRAEAVRDSVKQTEVSGRVAPEASISTLADISDEVSSCTGCSLSSARTVPVAGAGSNGAKLLIVGDWLVWEKGRQKVSGCVFGVEQDRMLGKMMDAIQFPRQQVFISNVIKCGIPGNCQPKAEHARACISYLYRQVARIKPEMILSMGMIATRTLLDRREPLSRLRGRLHTCKLPGGSKIPLIATYHPTYLLQNPEMKKATWYDLQILAKHLGINPS